MGIDKINIGYGGNLQYYEPEIRVKKPSWFKRTFWEFRPNNINHHVRSAYYLFFAIHQFKERHPGLAGKINLHLWGKIDPKNKELATKLNIQDLVHFSGLLDKESNLKKLGEMDMLFLPLEVGVVPDKSLFIPGKVYEYLLLEKPILSIGGDSDARDLVEQSGLGFQFDHDNLEQLISFLQTLVSGEKCLDVNPNKALIQSKSFKHLAGDLSQIFDKLLLNC